MIELLKKGVQLQADSELVWADSAAQYTHKQVSVTKPASGSSDKYEIIVVNPSLVSDLTVKIYNEVNSLSYGTSARSLVPVQFPAGTSVTVEKSTSAVIEDCEDAWNEQVVANVTLDVDGVDFKVGANAAKFTVAAGASTGILASEQIAGTNMTIYSHVRMWVKSTVALAAGDLQLLLDNSANCASPLETLDLPAVAANTWTLVHLALSDPDALIAIVSVGVKMVVDKGAFVLLIDDVRGMDMVAESILVDGFMNADDGIIDCTNATGLGAGEGFTSTVRVIAR